MMSPYTIVDASHDVAALLSLGAQRVEDVCDGDGALTGYQISPEIDLAGYAAAAVLARYQALARHAADKRYRIETGGIAVPGIGLVATDHASQSKLMAEMIALGADLRIEPGAWKLSDGTFAVLSNAQMLSVIIAARTHLAAAFATEYAVLKDIASGKITTTQQIDTAAWPANS